MSPNGGTATRGVRRLREALGQTAVIFVSAPTGYGKTFVVREALRMRGMPACWYEAQPWERDGFLEPLVERIRVARPDVGRRPSYAGTCAKRRAAGAAGRNIRRRIDARRRSALYRRRRR